MANPKGNPRIAEHSIPSDGKPKVRISLQIDADTAKELKQQENQSEFIREAIQEKLAKV